MEGKYVVAVRLPNESVFTLDSDIDGEILDRAKERLKKCVESYGQANTALFQVISYGVKVGINLRLGV